MVLTQTDGNLILSFAYNVIPANQNQADGLRKMACHIVKCVIREFQFLSGSL